MKTYNTEIHALGNRKYKLRCPLLVTIQDYGEEVIASIPEFGLYAAAVSEDLALTNLKDEIVSTYECLSDLAPEKLGRLMFCCLEAMRAVILEASG